MPDKNQPSADMSTNPNQAEVEQLRLHDKIVELRRIRGNHEIDESTYTDRIMQLIATTRTQALAEGRKEALELIAKQSGWEDSYDHFARQLGLVAKYGHSCQSCAVQPTKGDAK